MSTSSNLRAFLYALQVCVVSVAAFSYLWFVVKAPFLGSSTYIVLITLVAIAFFTVMVFQSVRLSYTATTMAKGMAENMILYSRELFTELYRGSPVPYLVIKDNCTVESANLAAIRLFGVQEGWFEGRNILESLKSEDDQRIPLITEYFKQSMGVNHEELMILRPDGSERWVLLSLFAFTDTKREHKGLLTLVDVTKQKEIDKAKTEFVSLASHQLRTPISSMKWNLELLRTAQDKGDPTACTTYIAKIDDGITRMENLVADFLSVSKLELGTLAPQRESIHFDTFMHTVLALHEAKAASRSIAIERSWNTDDMLYTDPHLLEMAVSNLISNAIKYTPEGGVVRIGSEMHGNHRVVTVSDTGMGIPEDEQEHVFTKIFRASNARREVTDGTGLGLYIVREVVRVLGGDVTFVSKVDEGTTFTIVLPK